MNRFFSKMLMFIFVGGIISSGTCQAARYVQPVQYAQQEEILISGTPVMVSSLQNQVTLYATQETLQNHLCCFYLQIENGTEKKINFYEAQIQVTDQKGRSVQVLSKEEVLKRREKSEFWKGMGHAFYYGLEAFNAETAGHHQVKTASDELLRQSSRRQVRQESERESFARQNAYQDWEERMHQFYLAPTTIFPKKSYEANFQIEIDPNTERKLEFLFFTITVEGEEHTFCFYCGHKKKEWYQFWQK